MIFDGLFFLLLHFVLVNPYFYPSKTGFTRPNDRWTGLCIKLWFSVCDCVFVYLRNNISVSFAYVELKLCSVTSSGLYIHMYLDFYKLAHSNCKILHCKSLHFCVINYKIERRDIVYWTSDLIKHSGLSHGM